MDQQVDKDGSAAIGGIIFVVLMSVLLTVGAFCWLHSHFADGYWLEDSQDIHTLYYVKHNDVCGVVYGQQGGFYSHDQSGEFGPFTYLEDAKKNVEGDVNGR